MNVTFHKNKKPAENSQIMWFVDFQVLNHCTKYQVPKHSSTASIPRLANPPLEIIIAVHLGRSDSVGCKWW